MTIFLFLALAILCKESALMLLPAIVAGDVLLNRTPLRELPRRHWPLAILGVGWLVVTFGWLSRSVGGAVRPIREQLLTQFKATTWYAWTIAMPVHLNVEPQFQVAREIGVVPAIGLVCFASAAWVGWLVLKANGRFLMILAGLWALPTTIMPLNVLVNERRAYMLVAVACVGVGVMWRSR